MSRYRKYTPEGFQDLLFQECFNKKNIEDNLKNLFKLYGFFEIETPTLEFYDVFIANKDIISTETMFKFYDQQGRILVLRPDMTVPIARVIATKLRAEDYPLRVSYLGKAFRFSELSGERQKESTHAGVELFGASTPEADAEVITTAINSLIAAGFENFQIDVGQVEFFKGLMEEAGCDESEIESIRVFIDKKDMLGVEQVIRDHEISEGLKEIILNLPAFFGTVDVIEKVKKRPLNSRSLEALCYLEKVAGIVNDYGLGKYLSIDLGMVQRLNYYSGVIFRGFTYGVGFPILSGGRYDGLVEKFGEKCSAVGFSININMVMTALGRQKLKFPAPMVDTIIGYDGNGRKAALLIASKIRNQGFVVEMDITNRGIEDIREYAEDKGIDEVIYVIDDNSIEINKKGIADVIKTTLDEILNKE